MSQEPSVFTRPLMSLTRYAVKEPFRVLVIGIAISLCGLYLASQNLGFKSSRNALINPDSHFNQLWNDYLDEFGGGNEAIVVVEGESAESIIPILDELSTKISEHSNLFEGVLNGIDISKIRSKGLHYLPKKELQIVEEFVKQSEQIIQHNWLPIQTANVLHNLCEKLDSLQKAPEKHAELHTAYKEADLLANSLQQFFASKKSYESPWPQTMHRINVAAQTPEIVAACSQQGTEYFIFPVDSDSGSESKNRAIGLVLLRLIINDAENMEYGTEAISTLRSLIASVQNKHPEAKIGLTGMIVMENDEMRISNIESLQSSILSFIGVAVLFIIGFGELRHPLPALAALAISFGWTLGYITLAVGHLNILSISFGVILIGLGIDFGVHYTARYIELRGKIRNPSEAILETASSVGPGILTGALTTSVAFYMAAFTDFVGIAELGIITGGGIMFCCIAALLLLPAMFQMIDGPRPLRHFERPLDIRVWLNPFFAYPKTLVAFYLVGVLLLCVGLFDLRYDHSLMNMQPDGLESVEVEKRLLEQGGDNIWYALSISNSREQLLQRKEEITSRFPDLRVREIVSLIPEDESERLPYIQSISASLANLPERPPLLQPSNTETLGSVIGVLQSLLEKAPDASMSQTIRRLNEVRAALRSMSIEECARRLTEYQYALAGDMLTRLHILASMSNPIPPDWSDLPEPFVSQFVSKGGKYLMRIYSSKNIWETDELAEFVTQVRTVDKNATGIPIQTYEASMQMRQGYQWAAVYSFIAIFVLLWLDFNSIKYTLLSLFPMLIGVAQTFSILGIFDIPLNPANLIVLPLILGIGIDDGVHIVHDYLHQKSSGTYELSRSTAISILMTTLTTTIGFGSLMIASHNGLQSLGRVLVIGVSCCFFSSVVLLPALFYAKNRKSAK